MKSIVIHAARDLRIADLAPEAPGPGQVQITLAVGGICGSDLHYFNHGGFGAIRLREPMILGHERHVPHPADGVLQMGRNHDQIARVERHQPQRGRLDDRPSAGGRSTGGRAVAGTRLVNTQYTSACTLGMV